MKGKTEKTENAIAAFTGAGQLATNAVGALAALGQQAKSSTNNTAYLTFNKFGEYRLGKDQLEVEEEDLFAVNPNSFEVGYICWQDRKVVGEKMQNITLGAVDKSSLPEVPNPEKWQDQLAIAMKEVGGDGIECVFKTSTHGGKTAIGNLADEIAKRANSNPESCIPVVRCEKSSYDHREYGKVYTPIFTVAQWMDSEGNVVEQVA